MPCLPTAGERRANYHFPAAPPVGATEPRPVLPTAPARPGAGSGSRLARVQELRAWLQEQGGRAPCLEPAEFAGYGLGMRCTEPLPQCQTAIQVPRSAMLTLDTAHQAKIGERAARAPWEGDGLGRAA